MDVRRILTALFALSLIGFTLAPAASAGFPPTPEYGVSCETASAEDQVGHTQAFVEDGDEEAFAENTTSEWLGDYVFCEFFPI